MTADLPVVVFEFHCGLTVEILNTVTSALTADSAFEAGIEIAALKALVEAHEAAHAARLELGLVDSRSVVVRVNFSIARPELAELCLPPEPVQDPNVARLLREPPANRLPI